MLWLYIPLSILLLLALIHYYILRTYLPHVVRIFQDKPLFIISPGQPITDVEAVRFATADNLALNGFYWPAARPRKGVILFGLEFGSNRWSCIPYCEFLHDQGFDVFTFEVRGQGDSDPQPRYDPLQWVTDFEVEDFQAALAYLKSRPDADPRGVGLFGISKGGSTGLIVAAEDPYIRCCVTDGVFATHSVMVPYMQKWIYIYCKSSTIARAIPDWYYRWAAHIAIRQVQKKRRCNYPHLEYAMSRLAPRPLFMIHGGDDNYVKPEMARALFDLAGPPKEFWLVEGAKHNYAFQLANDEYKQRVLGFFEKHLVLAAPTVLAASTNGVHAREQNSEKLLKPEPGS